jgi:hypothetical protein
MGCLKFIPNLYPEIAILFGYWYKSAQSIMIIIYRRVSLKSFTNPASAKLCEVICETPREKLVRVC